MEQTTKTYLCKNTPECKKAKSKMRYVRNVPLGKGKGWGEMYMCGRCFSEKVVP